MAETSTTTKKARELARAGALCLAFANTAAPRLDGRRRETLAPPSTPFSSYADLVAWGQRMGVLRALDSERLSRAAAERPQEAKAVFARGWELRAALMRIFTREALGKKPAPKDLETLNAALSAALPALRLAQQGDGYARDWGGDEEALDRPLWPVALSAFELLTSDKLRRRLRQCGAKGCRRLFIDGTGRRMWCDMNLCGNRAKGRRYRKLRRAARSDPLRLVEIGLVDDARHEDEEPPTAEQ